jgi:hypothetical protein
MNRKFIFAILLSTLFICHRVQAQTTNYAAYSLYVASFSRYASWPQPGGDFKITVLGKSKIYDELMKITANKNVNGLAYKIAQVENVNEIGDPQILFIPDNKSSTLDDVVKATSGKPVMIVTEREGLLRKGADFSFLIIDNKLRFDMNSSNLEKRNIKISSNLVSIANSSL